MELPLHYLPVRVCPHIEEYNKRARYRLKLAEYGSHHNVDALIDEEKEEVTFFPQKSQGHIEGLAQSLPLLPLFDKPFGDPNVVKDYILGVQSFSDTLDNLTHFVSQVYCMRRWNDAPHTPQFKNVESCKTIVNKLLKETTGTKKDLNKEELIEELHRCWDCGLSSLLKLYSSIKEAHNDECLHGFNKNFSGGLLCHVEDPRKEENVIVHARGKDFKDLSMTSVSRDPDNGLLLPHPLASVSVREPVSQISCTTIEEKVVVSIRQKHHCKILQKDDADSSLAVVAVSEFSDEHLSSVIFSPYIRREVLVSTEEGNVHLWDINTSPKAIHKSAATANKEWTCSYFAGHPRQIAVTTSDCVKIYDHRTNFQKASPLFVLSEDLVRPHERVMCSSFLGFPHHVVATDFSVFVMDQRFLTSPVLQWSHELVSAPQYIQVFQPNQAGSASVDKMIFLASHQPAEVMCFSLNAGSGQVATSPILPWQLSKIGEFANKHHIIKSSSDRTGLEGRLQASLAGLAATCLDEVPVVYQMNSYGDVFYQQLRLQENHEDESVSWSLPEPTASQRSSADKHAAQWLDSFHKSRDDESLHSSDVYQRNDSVSINMPELGEIMRCSNTHLKQDTTGKIKVVPERKPQGKRRSPQPMINITSLKTVSELPCRGSNTKLLLALKTGEEITQVLAEREKHHTKLKKKMRTEAIRELRTFKSPQKSSMKSSTITQNSSSQLVAHNLRLGEDNCDSNATDSRQSENFEWPQEVLELLQSPSSSSPPKKKRRRHIKSVALIEESDGSD